MRVVHTFNASGVPRGAIMHAENVGVDSDVLLILHGSTQDRDGEGRLLYPAVRHLRGLSRLRVRSSTPLS